MRRSNVLTARILGMIARMLLVFLVVVNLGVAAWWALHRPAGVVAPAPLDPSVPTLELVRASGAEPASKNTTALADPPSPGASTEAVAPALPAETPAPVAEQPAMVCASFGPYTDVSAAQAARSRLGTPGIQANVRSLGSTNVRGYNVVIPPLANREAAVAMSERLRAAGFNDLMLLNDGESANGIALGRFGAEANARRHQADLQAKGFAAQVAPIGGGGASSTHWLDVRAPAGFDPTAARSLLGAAQVQRRDCPV